MSVRPVPSKQDSGQEKCLLADIDVAPLSSFRDDSSPSSLFPPPPPLSPCSSSSSTAFLIFQDLKVVAVSLVPSCESNSNSLILIIGMARTFPTSLVGMTLHGQITYHRKITCPKLVRLIDYIDRYLVMNCQRHDRSWNAWDVMNVTLHGSSGIPSKKMFLFQKLFIGSSQLLEKRMKTQTIASGCLFFFPTSIFLSVVFPSTSILPSINIRIVLE